VAFRGYFVLHFLPFMPFMPYAFLPISVSQMYLRVSLLSILSRSCMHLEVSISLEFLAGVC